MQNSYSSARNFWIGLGGFIAGGVVGILGNYLLFASGVLSLFLKLAPENQPLVRLLMGIILVFIGLGLAGAVGEPVQPTSPIARQMNNKHRLFILLFYPFYRI